MKIQKYNDSLVHSITHSASLGTHTMEKEKAQTSCPCLCTGYSNEEDSTLINVKYYLS